MNFLIIVFTMLTSAFAAEPTLQIPANYLNIFTYEKNINSENIMVVHATADENCLPVVDPVSKIPIIDFYWLMNRTSYKPVHPVIKSNIHERMSAARSDEKENIFFIQLEDLSEVNIDIPKTQVVVETSRNYKGQCEATGKITLGDSDGNVTIVLQKIFVNAKKTLNPFKPKVKSITLIGLNALTGAPFTRTYEAN